MGRVKSYQHGISRWHGHGILVVILLLVRPNQKINLCVWVTGLKTLGREGTHFFLNIFFWKKYDFMHFERHFAFQNG